MRLIRPRRRAQSVIEVMMLVPVIMMVMVAMYYLWSVTFAAANCNMRAREYALHGSRYLGSRSHGTSGSAVLSGNDYQRATRWPASFSFSGNSSDTSIPGPGTTGQNVRATVFITSN
ncbi:MAG: hypothetical protein ABIO70_14235 [Pseudomonadota bacterium]